MNAEQITEELNLKAITALTCIMQDEERGVISPAAAGSAIRAIWDSVGGLISSDTFELLSLASEKYKGFNHYHADFIKVNGRLEGLVRVCNTGAIINVRAAKPLRRPDYNVSDNELIAKDMVSELLRKKVTDESW